MMIGLRMLMQRFSAWLHLSDAKWRGTIRAGARVSRSTLEGPDGAVWRDAAV